MTKKTTILIIFFIIVFIIALVYLITRSQPPAFNINRVLPAPDSQKVDWQEDLTIFLDKEFNAKFLNLVSIKTEPSINLSLQLVNPTIIKATHEPFMPSTKYLLKVFFANQEVYQWTLTTRELPVIADPKTIQSLKDFNQEYYPLASFLPTQQEFTIRYLNKLSLEIVQNGISQDEIVSWIKNKGVDPTSHKITWIDEIQNQTVE